MRWEALFADLDAQAGALEQAERAAEVEERTRAELGAITLVDRLRGALGLPLALRAVGGLALSGRLRRVGPDWLLLDEGDGREAVAVLAGLLAVNGLGRTSAVPGTMGVLTAKLGLRHVLRGIGRDRSTVRLHLVDGAVLGATIDRVGADFVEVAVHPVGEARRRGAVREVALVPLSAVVAVRREA